MSTWKEKHINNRNVIIKNKTDIIKKYKENIPIKEIARIYKISERCINDNLRLWGAIKRHGIKYLLGKLLKEE